VVGDPKQSIYRFRGADVSLFTQTRNEIKLHGGEEVILDTNFRSDPELIVFFNHVFSHLMSQDEEVPNYYEPVKAKSKDTNSEVVIEWIRVPQKKELTEDLSSHEAEAMMIAKHIEQLSKEGIPYKDMTILLRKMTHVKVYEQALAEVGIPFYVVKGRGFYDRQEVLDILHFLRILVQPNDRLAWAGVLRSPFCGVSDETILRIAMDAKWEGQIQDWLTQIQVTKAEQRKLQQLAALLDRVELWLGQLPVADLIEYLIEESGYEEVLWATSIGKQATANVKKLIYQANELTGLPAVSISAFLEWVEQVSLSQQDETEASIESEDSPSVKIMTIHQAKGLEFPIVYLPGLSDTPRQNHSLLHIHPKWGLVVQMQDEKGETIETEHFKQVQADEKRLQWEESVRLFYVALTRAEKRLILSGSATPLKGLLDQNYQWSTWLDGVIGYHHIDEQEGIWSFDSEHLPIRVHLNFENTVKSTSIHTISKEDIFNQYIAGKLKEEPLSIHIDLFQEKRVTPHLVAVNVTKWKQLVNCPRKFYYQEIIGIPEIMKDEEIKILSPNEKRKLPPTLKGQLVHQICEWLMDPDVSINELPVLIEKACDQFQLTSYDYPFIKGEMDPYLQRFIQSSLYQEKRKWKKIWREWDFTEEIAGLRISGQIDLMVQDQMDHWQLFDYKTDRISIQEVEQTALEYEPQLQLYILAFQQKMGFIPEQATLYFLEPDQFYSFSVTKSG
jgi:ATP-dependent exoDNAse (exonuclease V) beta subunit